MLFAIAGLCRATIFSDCIVIYLDLGLHLPCYPYFIGKHLPREIDEDGLLFDGGFGDVKKSDLDGGNLSSI